MRIVGADARLKGLAAPSNLCMNQSLEAHEGICHPSFCLHHYSYICSQLYASIVNNI